tara:strand:- start:11 stop:1327 length:1317 start_codon:yes stop_codon:yes gene_type:complete
LSIEVSGITISIFRILFGIVLSLQSIYWVITGFIQKNIIDPTFLFPFIKNVTPLSDNLMIYGLNGLLVISPILMIINKFYKIGLVIYLLSFTYLWVLCQGYFNNHYYLISLICFLLLFSKSPFSRIEKVRVPQFHLYSLIFLIVAVYIIAGINKLNPYWLYDVQPMTFILSKAGLKESSFLIPLLSYLGLFFDLFIGPILLFKKTRNYGIVFSIFFHVLNFIIFLLVGGEIGFFPFIMIATLILFIEPSWIEERLLTNNARILSRQNLNVHLTYLLLIFLSLQIIIPFRHFFFKGYVDYNGIGQRFSWRLKNMYKEPVTQPGLINFTVLTSNGDTVSTFHLGNINKANIILTDRQKTNLIYYPNMIPVFAKKIEDKFQESINNKNFDFIIHGECEIGFMGRKSELLFSPKIDLTKISSLSHKTNSWLNPLKQKPWDFK